MTKLTTSVWPRDLSSIQSASEFFIDGSKADSTPEGVEFELPVRCRTGAAKLNSPSKSQQ